MTDIVERLRDLAALQSLGCRDDCADAADEIERLRAALRIVATAELYDPATGIIDADVLEIAQQSIRAALGEGK